jgi:hypothetical protein
LPIGRWPSQRNYARTSPNRDTHAANSESWRTDQPPKAQVVPRRGMDICTHAPAEPRQDRPCGIPHRVARQIHAANKLQPCP